MSIIPVLIASQAAVLAALEQKVLDRLRQAGVGVLLVGVAILLLLRR